MRKYAIINSYMEKIRENILLIFSKTNLPKEDIELWALLLNELDETRLGDIYEFIQMTPESPFILNGNMKKKYNALKNNDLAAWNNVLGKEQKIINSLQ